MITSVLVANRGEIARRIFGSARSMGMRCVGVYVPADAGAPFVREADAAVRLDTGYLDMDGVVEAALASGADAVHPGYGFLSENGDFARRVVDAGLIWVGPSADVIDTMGDKLAAKRAAGDAGVPTLASALVGDGDGLAAIGYPVLVKAAAGGGGKGMRIVEAPEALRDAVAAAEREASSAFGDGTVFVERYVPRARHVEVQLLGDSHGNLVHLGERECSIQRRHQKIIEESPSPALDDAGRAAMGEAALALGHRIGYRSAGTVEFLVDDDTGDFFFLEMNTRLQVEHPVTEAVTGFDLVREQLRIAAGEPLGYTQADITVSGHAIEARLYAEDPANGFLPATGTVDAFWPAAEPVVRWDSGVEAGSIVGVEFDPMLAKVIAHAATRSEAASRLALALERLHLGGVTTNRSFLATTLRTTEFLEGDTTTDFIDRVGPRLHHGGLPPHEVVHAAIAAAMWLQGSNRSSAPVLASLPSGFRIGRLPPQQVILDLADGAVVVDYERRREGTFQVRTCIDEGEPSTSPVDVGWTPRTVDLVVDGIRRVAAVTRAGDAIHVQAQHGTVTFMLRPRFALTGSAAVTGGLTAPMPGTVLEVRCAPGDVVAAGQTLVVLEAMKMEHHMDAPADGVVAAVHVTAGGRVDNGQLLVAFEDNEQPTAEGVHH